MVCELPLEELLEILQKVLILVLMEYGLRGGDNLLNQEKSRKVLILVLMEYGLRAPVEGEIWRINPSVLILVLMEYGLRAADRLPLREFVGMS